MAKEAIERARRGDGPTLVECETYRFRGHSLADPDELRDPGKKLDYALCFEVICCCSFAFLMLSSVALSIMPIHLFCLIVFCH